MQGLTKAVPCQLHGEKLQRFEIWCPHGCARINRVNRKLAITAWNTRPQVAELVEVFQWAFDTLIELNPSNYDHNNVCEVNAAAVEVMLGLKPILASHKGEQP
jgi:hypothetical protein